ASSFLCSTKLFKYSEVKNIGAIIKTLKIRSRMENDKIRVLIVGCGNMGASHAMAYDQLHADFEICGLVSRGDSKHKLNKLLKANYPVYDSYHQALQQANPNAVCISTYPDTHQEYTLAAFEAGCDVFLEKPIATTAQGAKALVEAANKTGKKL